MRRRQAILLKRRDRNNFRIGQVSGSLHVWSFHVFLIDVQFSYASFSSDDTDDLSTLGVPVGQKEFVDPLSAWNDLEPELDVRRSKNLEDMNNGRQLETQVGEIMIHFNSSVLHLSLPPGTDISLTGPTGYPVLLPSPVHSPTGTLNKLHYHIPEDRQERHERTKSGEWRKSGDWRKSGESRISGEWRSRTPTNI